LFSTCVPAAHRRSVVSLEETKPISLVKKDNLPAKSNIDEKLLLDQEAATVPGARVHLFLNAEIRIGSEMEFSDISLIKDLSLFAQCYSRSLLVADFKENHTLLWF
jgi:hypothetical protein